MKERDTLSWRYRLFLVLMHVVFRFLVKVDARGAELTPQEGPLLIAWNHISNWDAPLIFSQIRRHPVSAMAKQEHKDTPVGWLVGIVDGIFVARGEIDRVALKEVMVRLKAGRAIGIAPEGTRSHTGHLAEGKEGLAYLALQTGAPVQPVVAWGQERAWDALKRLRRPTMYVRFGQPFTLVADPALDRRENITAGTHQIMHALARLLPPEYRGFYADEVRGAPIWE